MNEDTEAVLRRVVELASQAIEEIEQWEGIAVPSSETLFWGLPK